MSPGAGVGNTSKDGAIIRMLASLLDEYGVDWYEVPISSISYSLTQDSYDACVHEILLNGTDICIGDFWVTPDRFALVTMVQPLYNIRLTFITSRLGRRRARSVYSSMRGNVKPFSYDVWLATFGTLAYVGLAFWWIEGGRSSEDDDSPLEGSTPSQRLVTSQAWAFQSLWGGGDIRYGPRTVGVWMCVFGLSFLITVLMANYTADVTADLVALTHEEGAISSLDDVIRQKVHACTRHAHSFSLHIVCARIFDFAQRHENRVSLFSYRP